MNKIEVISLDKRFETFSRGIKFIAKKSLKVFRQNNKVLEVYLVGNAEMRFLNKVFRHKNKPTNVLSFKEPKGFIEPKSNFKRLGDIYLGISFIKKQVQKKLGEDYESTVKKMLIHGLLHLLGYTHNSRRDKIKMEKKEQELLRNV